MKRIKTFSNFDFIAYGSYHCPVCGEEIKTWRSAKMSKALSTPFGVMKEYILTCDTCRTEIDYLMAAKSE